MLPLSLLTTSQTHPILVELKNGETFNGHLVNCDNWMNLTLREVIQTSADGDRFWRLTECYIRGNTIKYLRVPDEIIDMVKEEANRQRLTSARNSNRGGSGGSGDNQGRGNYHQGGGDRGRGGGRGRGGDHNKSGGRGYSNDRGGARGGGPRGGRGRGGSQS